MLEKGWLDEAGRACYLAGYNAARGYVFEMTDQIVKTHSGVQTLFAQLTKDNPAVDLDLKRFLGRSFSLKAIADYETGEEKLTVEEIETTIVTAQRFIKNIFAMIG